MIKKLLFILLFFVICSQIAYALPAFPGAEGMGASSVGGRGGTVYIIDTLSDNPADGVTFREACTASGARIIVFAVSGHIHLTSTLWVTNPYLTIAGQTSPGGVLVSGGMFGIQTHDVIVTHMRFRMGSDVCTAAGNCDDYGDAVRIMAENDGPAYNIIFDHCSISWGCDETVDIGGYGDSVYDVTFSWCIIAQGLDDPSPEVGAHGYGVNVQGKYDTGTGTPNVSMHHNYLAHFSDRIPWVLYDAFLDFRNNVVYNWYGRLSIQQREVDGYTLTKMNVINNHTKVGSLLGALECGVNVSGIFLSEDGDGLVEAADARQQLYVNGNTGCSTDNVWSGWSAGANWVYDISPNFFASSAHSTTDIAVTTSTMNDSYVTTILSGAGATKPSRDSIDTQFVLDYTNVTGSTLSDILYSDYPTGWPVFDTPAVPTDSDSDGMVDSWETSEFGDLSQTPTGDYDLDGYTNIEEYLFYLAGYQGEGPGPGPESGSVNFSGSGNANRSGSGSVLFE